MPFWHGALGALLAIGVLAHARVRATRPVAYLFISHDIGVVRVMSDRIAVMRAGRIVGAGDADAIYRSPRDEYTRSLLAAVPVADPALMAERRALRAAAR